MDAVESVRIVRDSTSLTLGPIVDLGTPLSGPNQGYVIITTRKGSRLEGGIVAEYGRFQSREMQIYHGNRIGAFNYRLTATANGSDGRSGWYTTQKAQSVLFNGGYDGSGLKIDTTVYYQYGKRNMEHSFTNTTNNAYWGYDPMEALWIAANISKLWTPDQITSLSYSHGTLTDTEVMGTSTPANNQSNVKYTYMGQRDVADNVHLWHTARFGNNILKAGFQSVFWYEPTGFAAWDGKKREEYIIGGYLQDEQSLMGGRLTLDAGARVDDKYIKRGVDKYSPTQNTTALINDKWGKPVISTSVGAAYRLDDIHTATARFGFSHAETDSFLATVDNKKLGAETRYKYEAGVEGKYHHAFNPKLTLFYYDIKNFKTSVGTSGTGVNVVNVYDEANVGRYGLEFSTTGALPYGFSYSAAYSYFESTKSLVNSTMPRTGVSFLLSHRYGPVQSNFSLRYVGPFKNNSFTKPVSYVDVGDFTRADANVSYAWKIAQMQGKFTAYAQNMLGDKYETINGFPDQGAVYGLRMELGF